MNKTAAAIYARVSSDQQAEAGTIESQVAALKERVTADGFVLPDRLQFIDAGCSGATLVRPELERLRDAVAAGELDCIYVHSPDRLARNYAYQVLLVDEFKRAGVEVIFLNRALGQSPEDDLLLQVQGMMAEYERKKMLERSRRGKRHKARSGSLNAMAGAPYGYRYVDRHEGGGEARYEIMPEQADVVRQIFTWIGRDRVSMGEVRRRLQEQGVLTQTGKSLWDRSTLQGLLNNPAYKGNAAFGRTRVGPQLRRRKVARGRTEERRRPWSVYSIPEDEWLYIPVPAIVSEALYEAVQEQLKENRRRLRQSSRGAIYLLQGLLVCGQCGYAFYGRTAIRTSRTGERRDYIYYCCVGADPSHVGGERVCHNKPICGGLLDEAVWQEVCRLLKDPHRLEEEYLRRLEGSRHEGEAPLSQIEHRISKLRRGLMRLIDSYADELIEKEEFEPRIKKLREQLTALETQARQLREERLTHNELRLIIGQLHEFSTRVVDGLSAADWQTRRDLIRTLVKRVEIDDSQVKVVFRVGPPPASSDLVPEFSPDCRKSAGSVAGAEDARRTGQRSWGASGSDLTVEEAGARWAARGVQLSG